MRKSINKKTTTRRHKWNFYGLSALNSTWNFDKCKWQSMSVETHNSSMAIRWFFFMAFWCVCVRVKNLILISGCLAKQDNSNLGATSKSLIAFRIRILRLNHTSHTHTHTPHRLWQTHLIVFAQATIYYVANWIAEKLKWLQKYTSRAISRCVL